MFDNSNLGRIISPVEDRDFIWVAEYLDGTWLSEFDAETRQENSFYNIDRNRLIRFGLVGHGMKLFNESDGIFKLQGTAVEVIYRTADKDYYLTGQFLHYNDIIQYKDAESNIALNSPNAKPTGRITQYNFGYKVKLNFDEVNVNFKAICKVPFQREVYLNFWLVSDKDMDGCIVIKRNGKEVQSIHAPLKSNVGGEVNWVVG